MAERTARAQAEVVALMTAGYEPADLEQVRAVMTTVSERLRQALDAGD